MDERKNLPFILKEKEPTTLRDRFTKKVGSIKKSVPSASEIGKTASEIAKKGIKGGVIGASAAAVNGVVAGATGSAVGAITATGIGGAIAATGAGAVALSAAPLVAGFGAACIIGSAVSDLVNKN